jgi:SRSO17 transposase
MAVSLSMATEEVILPVAYQLYLPMSELSGTDWPRNSKA